MVSSKTGKPASRRVTKKTSPANMVEEQLARYRSMRDFSVTAEPSGKKRPAKQAALPFCIQKHSASHLHYDFRLGWNGVLKSWAVAKGPSLYTGDKRLAVQVEDHPIEYGGFEGIIPKGQYGGGTVMLWDEGTWEPQAESSDVEEALKNGSLKFILHGTRLRGKWALIRMKSKWAKESKPNWLLVKEHDSYEQGPDDDAITDTEQTSVATGRTMEVIARSQDHIWNSRQSAQNQDTKRSHDNAKNFDATRWIKELPEERQPSFIEPELATMTDAPPSAAGWLHELKLDGYRIQARRSGSTMQMLTRTGLDWTSRMRHLANEIAQLPAQQFTLDGELVVLAPNGTTSFAALQASMQEGAAQPLTYFAFDLLHLNGHNTRGLPLKERKQILAALLSSQDSEAVQYSEHLETGGTELLHQACKLQAEGIISKRGDVAYKSGRNKDWLKSKCLHEQEFVVGGFTLPTNGIQGVGALLLGYYDGNELIYAGRTGTGFTQKTHRLLRGLLDPLRQQTSPFVSVPPDGTKGALWVKPERVVQVRFASWTADHLVRQAAFLGVREDKPARDVLHEQPAESLGPRSSSKSHVRKRNVVAEQQHVDTTRRRGSMTDQPIRLTHPDKVLDEASGLTKQALAEYYRAIAPHLLPEITGRPLSIVRAPDGTGKPSFFQKHASNTLPDGIDSVAVPDKKTGAPERYITIYTEQAIVSLAQISVLELHPWGSRNEDLEHPDRLIFDIDPDEGLPWELIVSAANEIRSHLQKLQLEGFVKTTGGKGLHVVVPIDPTLDWQQAKQFTHEIVQRMEKDHPDRYLTRMTKSARKGKIFLDYLRNERGATAVAAYSPRARAGVGVSMPLSWTELQRAKQRPIFSVVDFADWRSRLSRNQWKDLHTVRQTV